MDASAIAYEKIKPLIPSLLEQIYDEVKRSPGVTRVEVQERLGLNSHTASARMTELTQQERIRVTGRKWVDGIRVRVRTYEAA